MNTEFVTLQLPVSLYEKLQTLATAEHTDVYGVIALITDAYQQRGWLQDLTALRRQIRDSDGGLEFSSTKKEVVAQLRQTRQEVFEAEYAHLYR